MKLNKKQSLVAMAVLAGISAQPALAENNFSVATWPPLAVGGAAAYTLAAACGYGNAAAGAKSASAGANSLAKKADAGKKKATVARKKPKAEPAVATADAATGAQPAEIGATLTLATAGETGAPAFSSDKSYADPAAPAETASAPAIAESAGDFSPSASYADPAAADIATSISPKADTVAGLLIPAAAADSDVPANAAASASAEGAITETAKPRAKAQSKSNGKGNGKAQQLAANSKSKTAAAANAYAYGGSGNCLMDFLQVSGKLYVENCQVPTTANVAVTPINGSTKPGYQTVAWHGTR